MESMKLDPAIGLLIVAGAALLFARAAAHKLRDLPRFVEIFSAYGMLPPSTARYVAWLVPLLELGTVLGLLFGEYRAYASCLGVLLLLTYACAIGINLRRGRRDLACGCGGPSERRPIAPWMILRNIVLALAIAGTLAPWAVRPLTFTDAVTVSFGLLTLALVYECTEQLMAHSPRTAQLRISR
jgi:hypothetical protein